MGNKRMPTDRTNLSFMLSSCFQELCELLEINLDDFIVTENEVRGKCPIHDSDNTTAFAYYFSRNLWFCWTGKCHDKKGSDLIGLIALKLDLNIRDACWWAQKFLKKKNITADLAARLRAKHSIQVRDKEADYWKEHISQETFDESCLQRLQSASRYLKGRSLDPRLGANLGAGYAIEGKMRGRVVLPVRNVDDKLVGFTGRIIQHKSKLPKWLHLPRRPRFQIGLNLYNIQRASRFVRRTNSAILVEGPFDMMKLEMAGFGNSLAIFGLNISRAQVEVLKHCGLIYAIVGFDPDRVDSKESRDTIGKLQTADFDVRILRWKGSEDFGDMKIAKVREVLTQVGDIQGFENWRIR